MYIQFLHSGLRWAATPELKAQTAQRSQANGMSRTWSEPGCPGGGKWNELAPALQAELKLEVQLGSR